MRKCLFLFLIFINSSFSQQSDFKHIDFTKADFIGKTFKSRKLVNLQKVTLSLTENLETEVEKFRAIYIWICHNIANDYGLYVLNDRKRKKFSKDSIRLSEWNSHFKKVLFKKLIKRKKTICTGYAYLLKEMCEKVGIEAKMVNGYGRTSDVYIEDLEEPNHTWNVVKLNGKWYLCDPTWATGISYPEEGKFKFLYNDGYFLTEPKVFFQNHFPLENDYSLLQNSTPKLTEFIEMPLLYAEAYNILKESLLPLTMHNELKVNETFTFKYKLTKQIDVNKIRFVISTGIIEKTIKPKIILQENKLTLQNTFTRKGFYDVHFYIDSKIIATYTFNVTE